VSGFLQNFRRVKRRRGAGAGEHAAAGESKSQDLTGRSDHLPRGSSAKTGVEKASQRAIVGRVYKLQRERESCSITSSSPDVGERNLDGGKRGAGLFESQRLDSYRRCTSQEKTFAKKNGMWCKEKLREYPSKTNSQTRSNKNAHGEKD